MIYIIWNLSASFTVIIWRQFFLSVSFFQLFGLSTVAALTTVLQIKETQ